MYKRIALLLPVVSALLLLVLASCGGGGSQDSVGFAFPEDCAACHGGSPEYPLNGVKYSYDQSGHNLGYEREGHPNAYYANGGGCQVCHTSEGFIQFVATGTVDTEGFIENPSQPTCITCHTFHDTGDFTLRTTAPVTLTNNVTFDFGRGNLCANCHQSRSDASTYVQPIAAGSVSSRIGGHHGPEADLLAGTNAYEFPGKSYSSSAHASVVKDTCVACHMALPEGRYALSDEVGGHSFYPIGGVHGSEKINAAACVECHKDIGQADIDGVTYFDQTAKDYDQDGTLEPLQAEVAGLLDMFVNDSGTGVFQTMEKPFYDAGGNWVSYRDDTEDRPADQIGSIYNYKVVLEDRSLGVHNPKYAVEILYDSLAVMDPTFDVSMRP